MGGGFELALCCDILIASQNAVFALPEPKVGLAALAGGIQRLARSVGYQRAMSMLLTGRRINAEEALDCGLISEIASGSLLDCALAWANQILECSPLSVRATKESVRLSQDMPVETAIKSQFEFPAMAEMLSSEDAIEGPKAFAEKRAPHWKNR